MDIISANIIPSEFLTDQGAKKDHFISYQQGLYPFTPSKVAIFSWRAIASQGKIATLLGMNGYNLCW